MKDENLPQLNILDSKQLVEHELLLKYFEENKNKLSVEEKEKILKISRQWADKIIPSKKRNRI
ncbi:MAG: hypothetical protein SFY32_16795 [Bacteroidota bacterium]|nr:hypothetical protein [Bacteroidota bacterium]